MRRRVLAEKIEGGKALLGRDEVHHLRKVLRMGPEAEFEAVGPDQRRYLCRLAEGDGEWYGRVVGVSSRSWESPLRVRLCQALIKRDKFEWVAQKAVELGVAELIPIETTRSELRIAGDRRGRKLDRWQKIVVEAVKQCGRTVIPVVREPISLAESLSLPEPGLPLALDEESEAPPASFIEGAEGVTACSLYVGPEGGWDDRDRQLLDAHGVGRFRLGPRILRAETAALVALALVQAQWGDLTRNPTSFRIDYRDV